MSLIETIDKDLIKALKGGEKDTATTLRGLKSDMKYYQIDKKIDKLTDDDVIAVLSAAAKRRRDSIEQYRNGKREDLVAKETAELGIISAYLPAQMTDEEIEVIVRETLTETGASTMAEMGNVMKAIMPKVKGRADGKAVKNIVNRLLSS